MSRLENVSIVADANNLIKEDWDAMEFIGFTIVARERVKHVL